MYLREFLLKLTHPITQYNTGQINTKVRVTDHKSFNVVTFPIPPPPQIQLYGSGEHCIAPPAGSPQTHFDASTGLKTHLVAASFSFPQHFLWRKMRHSPLLGLDAPGDS